MSLIEFGDVRYMPILGIRPAEMVALQELPERSKGDLAPLIVLGPWVSAHRLDSSLERVERSFGLRPIIVDMPFQHARAEQPRPVHDELEELRLPQNGYENWCHFIAERPTFVPTAQLGDAAEIDRQFAVLSDLDRGVVVRIRPDRHQDLERITRSASRAFDSADVMIVIDYERATRDLLTRSAEAIALIDTAARALPNCNFCITATSFPSSFTNIVNQPIYERQFFDMVRDNSEHRERLHYSDRGSVRFQPLGGGGRVIPARVDYPTADSWLFYRHEDENRAAGYRAGAQDAMRSNAWDPDLRVWGSQMIERTALGDREAISSQARATAVRINMHLQRQLYYDHPELMYETDDEWSD